MKRHIMILALVIISLFSIQIAPVHAAPIACSQAALQAALDVGGVIDMPADCTIVLDSMLTIIRPTGGYVPRNIIINGNGAVLDGNNKTPILLAGAHRLTIDNLTMQNANGSRGALDLEGGVIEATVKNSVFRNNHSSSDGGAIKRHGGSLTIINTIIEGNSAISRGGGIYHSFGELTIINSFIVGNRSAFTGGGLWLEDSGVPLIIQNSRITDNFAPAGAAIWGSNVQLSGNCLQNNISANGFDVERPVALALMAINSNWWGAATGPNTPGADTTNAPVSSWLDAPPPSCNLFASPEYDPARINGHDNAPPVVVFYHEFEDGEGLVVYGPFGGELLIVTPEDIAAVDECPAENTLIAANEDVPVWLYRLSTCWFQINAFTSEGKLYTLIFDQLGPGRESISFEEWIGQ